MNAVAVFPPPDTAYAETGKSFNFPTMPSTKLVISDDSRPPVRSRYGFPAEFLGIWHLENIRCREYFRHNWIEAIFREAFWKVTLKIANIAAGGASSECLRCHLCRYQRMGKNKIISIVAYVNINNNNYLNKNIPSGCGFAFVNKIIFSSRSSFFSSCNLFSFITQLASPDHVAASPHQSNNPSPSRL